MKNTTLKLATAIATITAASAASSATLFTQDFDAMDISGASVPGFVIGNRNYDGGEWFESAAAPNSNEKYSKLEAGNGGTYLSTFSDYSSDGPFGPGQWGGSTDASTYVYTDVGNVSSDQVGETVTFDFEARRTNLDLANATADAYLKLINPNTGWSETLVVNQAGSDVGTDWGSYSVSFDVEASHVGQLIQVGFTNRASSDGTQAGTASTGMNYDNLIVTSEVAAVPVPAAAWLFGSALAGLTLVRRRK